MGPLNDTDARLAILQPHSEPPAPSPQPLSLHPKAVATLQARAALAGAVLVESTGDDGLPLFVLSKWSMTRAFNMRELDSLTRTILLMGGGAE